MSLFEDGTITTQENDTYQEEMIQSLFSTENFSEVDTCVEIMGTTRILRGSSLASPKGCNKSVSSQSRLSRKGRLRSPGSHADDNSVADHTATTAPGVRLQPKLDDSSSEDVRKVIAKIRLARESAKPQKIEEEEEKTDKMLVNPGKYGEVDLRSPGALVRKQLFNKMKKEQDITKRSSAAPGKTEPPKVSTAQSEASTERREGVQDVHAREEHRDSQKSYQDNWTKHGYYKNKGDEGPAHIACLQGAKRKAASLHERPEIIRTSNSSVASSRKTTSHSVVSRRSSKKSEVKCGETSVSSMTQKRNNAGIVNAVSNHQPTASGGPSVSGQSQERMSGSSSGASKSQQQECADGSIISKSQQKDIPTSSILQNSQNSSDLSRSHSNVGISSLFSTSQSHNPAVVLKDLSTKCEEIKAQSITSEGATQNETETTSVESLTVNSDPKNEVPKLQSVAEPHVEATHSPASTGMTAIALVEKVDEQSTDNSAPGDASNPGSSGGEEPQLPISSMPMAQIIGANEFDEPEEIECVLAPFGDLADNKAAPDLSIRPDPSASIGDSEAAKDSTEMKTEENPQQPQQRGGSPPGEKCVVPDQEEFECPKHYFTPEDVDNIEKHDAGIIHKTVSSFNPITVMSISTLEQSISDEAVNELADRLGKSDCGNEPEAPSKGAANSLLAAMHVTLDDIGSSEEEASSRDQDASSEASHQEQVSGDETGEEPGETLEVDTLEVDVNSKAMCAEETIDLDTGDLVHDSVQLTQLENENAKLKDTLNFLQLTAVEKEKYFAELAWFGKRSEEEVQKWRPHFWQERLEEFGPELFEEFRADAMRIADPDVGDWEHGFSSGALAMARLLLGLSHAVDDEKICAFHDFGQPCTIHCVTCSVSEQRQRELADFPVLDP